MPETGSWNPPVESSFSNPILPEVFMNHSSHIYRFLVRHMPMRPSRCHAVNARSPIVMLLV